ncbi:hypothetical protein [Paractinoplanes rishiriensis]|uniref:hypothetical protein n=1 Tax=Paractinoplanes rishiriensis TaxID=1050105 RepID=UPI001942E5D4|nr:hypothetical protein [Actinoplanes rishiriensis]
MPQHLVGGFIAVVKARDHRGGADLLGMLGVGLLDGVRYAWAPRTRRGPGRC